MAEISKCQFRRTFKLTLILSFICIIIFSSLISIQMVSSFKIDGKYETLEKTTYSIPEGTEPVKLFHFQKGDYLVSIRHTSGELKYDEIIKVTKNGSKVWSFFTTTTDNGFLHDFVEDLNGKNCYMLVQEAKNLYLYAIDCGTGQKMQSILLTNYYLSTISYPRNARIFRDGLSLITVFNRFDGIEAKEKMNITKYAIDPTYSENLMFQNTDEIAGPSDYFVNSDVSFNLDTKRITIFARIHASGLPNKNSKYLYLFDVDSNIVMYHSRNITEFIPSDFEPLRIAKDHRIDEISVYAKNDTQIYIITFDGNAEYKSQTWPSLQDLSIYDVAPIYPEFDVFVGSHQVGTNTTATLVLNTKTITTRTSQESFTIKDFDVADRFMSVSILNSSFLILGLKDSTINILLISDEGLNDTVPIQSIWQNPYFIVGFIIIVGVAVFLVEHWNRKREQR